MLIVYALMFVMCWGHMVAGHKHIIKPAHRAAHLAVGGAYVCPETVGRNVCSNSGNEREQDGGWREGRR